MQLAGTEDEKVLQDTLNSEEYEFRYACGVTKPSNRISIGEKGRIVRALCLHKTVYCNLAELEQLHRGLALQKFDLLMENHPSIIRKAFQPPEIRITSNYIQDLFKPSFSAPGNNKREKEEAVMMAWVSYLQDIELQVGECTGIVERCDDISDGM